MSIYGGMFREGPSEEEYKKTDGMIEYANAFREYHQELLAPHLEDIKLTQFGVLCVLFRPSSKTASGLHLPNQTVDELTGATKAFLIIAMGDGAFKETDEAYALKDIFSKGNEPKVGDWVLAKPHVGWPLKFAGVNCKKFEDRDIIAKLGYPQSVF